MALISDGASSKTTGERLAEEEEFRRSGKVVVS